jgi:hypothetical protein
MHPETAGNISKKTSILDADEELTIQNHSKLAFNNYIKDKSILLANNV